MKQRSLRWLARLGSPLVLLIALIVVVIVRGTWASTEPINPAHADDSVVCQLYQWPDGRKVVRAAVVLDTPRERAWMKLSDVNKYPEMFSTIHTFQRETDSPDQVKVDVQTFWGLKHLEGTMHVEDGPTSNTLTFNELHGDADVHLVRLTLTSPEPTQTLLVYEVDADVPGYPTFLVRNVFRSRNAAILRMIRHYFKTHPES